MSFRVVHKFVMSKNYLNWSPQFMRKSPLLLESRLEATANSVTMSDE